MIFFYHLTSTSDREYINTLSRAKLLHSIMKILFNIENVPQINTIMK